MFETILGLQSSFSEMSLQRLSSILKEPTKNNIQKLIEHTIQYYFQENQNLIEQKSRTLDQITKEQFYITFKKTFSKCVRKESRKIEEIINYQANRGGSTKQWLKNFFTKLDYITINLYHFIKEMQNYNKWEHCSHAECEFIFSSYKFQIDIFNFIVQTNQHLRNEIKRLVEKKQSPHMIFEIESEILHKNDLLSNVDFVLSMETNCQDHITAKKKRKNKNKNKKVHKSNESCKEEEQQYVEEDERKILFMLNNLQISEEDRIPCHVTEDWISRIASAYGKR